MSDSRARVCGVFCRDYCPGAYGERRCSLGLFDESRPELRPKTGRDYVVIRPEKCGRTFFNEKTFY